MSHRAFLFFCSVVLWGVSALASAGPSSSADTLFEHGIVKLGSSDTLLEITRQLRQKIVVRSSFEQSRTMRVLRKPIRSSGTILYAKNKGLYWQTTKPFISEMVITDRVLIQKDGEHLITVTAQQQPVLFAFSQAFFYMLGGDLKSLSRQFTIHLEGDTTAWRIGLLPKDKQLKQFIHRVELRGGQQLDSVQVIDRSGDKTDMHFQPVPAGNSPLIAAELAHFDF